MFIIIMCIFIFSCLFMFLNKYFKSNKLMCPYCKKVNMITVIDKNYIQCSNCKTTWPKEKWSSRKCILCDRQMQIKSLSSLSESHICLKCQLIVTTFKDDLEIINVFSRKSRK